MATEQPQQNSLHKSETTKSEPNNEAIYAQATFTPPASVTQYIPTPLTLFTPMVAQGTEILQDTPTTLLDKDLSDFVATIDTSLPVLSTLHPILPDIKIKPEQYLDLAISDIASIASQTTITPINSATSSDNIPIPTNPTKSASTKPTKSKSTKSTKSTKSKSTNPTNPANPTNPTSSTNLTSPTNLTNPTNPTNPTNSTNTDTDTTPKGKKKRGRKPAQDPPYTILYKKPWLDEWATCRRLALEYINETKVIAQRANLPLAEVRRLPSQADLSGGNSMRVWMPMELILARAFLKEANLVNTSTKKGAVLCGDISLEQLPDLISKSVLPSTHAVHYVPKERPKDPNAPEKPKKPKKQKSDPPQTATLPPPPPQLSPFFQLSIPKDPIPFWKCE